MRTADFEKEKKKKKIAISNEKAATPNKSLAMLDIDIIFFSLISKNFR